MKPCPFCAEKIQDDAVKCRFCGEWVRTSPARQRAGLPRGTGSRHDQLTESTPSRDGPPDFSRLNLYQYRLRSGWMKTKYARILAHDKAEAIESIEADLEPGYRLDKHWGLLLAPRGRFSCPRCGSRFTDCERQVGCLVVILIFVSLGLGLLMVPFLPFHCWCRARGHKWKS